MLKAKIATFGIILKNAVYDETLLTDELIKKGFEKRFFKVGLMKAHHKDGTEIPNNAALNEYSDQYQLRKELCSVAFTGDDLLIHHKFGVRTLDIDYDFKKVFDELQSVLNVVNSLSSSDRFELLLVLRATGTKNPEEVISKWMKKRNYDKDKNISDVFIVSEQVMHLPDANQRCTKRNVMVRDGEYAIELRFESNNLNLLCNDFKNSEKTGCVMIKGLENEN